MDLCGTIAFMAEPAQRPITQLLDAAAAGRGSASEELLPLVYDELRRLAASQMQREPAGHTLQPTALVHEAYLRLIGNDATPVWNSRAHFFGAAALAMRRILVERARRKGRVRHGGGSRREELTDDLPEPDGEEIDLVALDEALSRLEAHNAEAGRVVMLRYFAGLSIEDTAAALGVGVTTVKDDWAYARAWLRRAMEQSA